MFVLRVGYYAWLGTGPNGLPCVTTSGAHATSYPNGIAAGAAVNAFYSNRAPVLANSVGNRRLLAYWRTALLSAVPAAEHEARMAQCNGRHSSGNEEHPAPRPAGTPKPPRPGHPVAEKAPRAPGVTRQVYQWVLDHPQATKADALAAFPSANPTTVGVQFGAARRAA